MFEVAKTLNLLISVGVQMHYQEEEDLLRKENLGAASWAKKNWCVA